MNKKVLTLCAGFLLAGSTVAFAQEATVTKVLPSVGGALTFTDGKLTLDDDYSVPDSLKGYYIINTPNVTLDGKNKTLTGRLVIAAENVTIKNLDIVNSLESAVSGGFWNNTAVTVFADDFAITGSTITGSVNDGNSTNCINGIVIYPQGGASNYEIDDNTISGFAQMVTDSYGRWYSSAFQVYQNRSVTINTEASQPENLAGLKVKGINSQSSTIANADKLIATVVDNNDFEGNDADVVVRDGAEVNEDGTANTKYAVDGAYLTYPSDEAESEDVTAFQAALADALQAGDANTTLTVEGATPTQIQDVIKALVTTSLGEDEEFISTKALSAANIVINTVNEDGASTGAVVLGTVANAPAGALQISIASDGEVSVAPLADVVNEMATGHYYLLADKDNPTNVIASKWEVENYSALSASEKAACLWAVDAILNTSADGKSGYATLINKDGDVFLDGSGTKRVAIKVKLNEDKVWVIDYKDGKAQFVTADNFGETSNEHSKNIVVVDAPANTALSYDTLIKYLGESFDIKLSYNNKALKDDELTGTLTPVDLNDGTYALKTAEDKYLVVVTSENLGGSGTHVYSVEALTKKQLDTALSGKNASNYAYKFTIYAYDDYTFGETSNVARIEAQNNVGDKFVLGALSQATTSGVTYYLAAERPTTNWLGDLNIEMGHFNVVDVEKLLGNTPAFFTVTNKNVKKVNKGQVLGINEYGYAAFVKPENALVGYPETQWAITYDAEAKTLTFKNRENPDAVRTYEWDEDTETAVPVNYIMSTDHLYNVPGKTNVFAYYGDTLEIKAITDYKESDGYKRYNFAELEDQNYYVGVYNAITESNTWMVENHGTTHQVGLVAEQTDATEWALKPAMSIERDVYGEVETVTPDTVEVKSILGYYKNGTYTETVDADKEGTVILKFPAYALRNSANGEYMAYSSPNEYYVTGADGQKKGYTNVNNADFFALKEVGNGRYQLVTVNHTSDEEDPITALTWNKAFGGHSADKGMIGQTTMYDQTENDIFSIVEKAAPEYAQITMGDTIRIYRNDDPEDVLYEKGEFLGTPTSLQFDAANPALYVDTAYVNRPYNNRWEYLLAVDAKHWESNLVCEIPEHPKHYADTTSGRFLVNLMDSAYVYHDNNIHNNKFINEEDGEVYAKLGFVEGYHTHDTLYLKRPNGTYNALPMTREDYSHSIAKFAFRYIDSNSDAFVIETGIKNFYASEENRDEVSRGYIKWLNGTLVVVPDIEAAEIFNLNADETRTPTANESINAEGAVSVTAVDGAVVIKGAEGKNVVIATILGKVVANETINSDNETIAVPAGITVVSVDGESFKVVVK